MMEIQDCLKTGMSPNPDLFMDDDGRVYRLRRGA